MTRMIYDGDCGFCQQAAGKVGASGRVECLASTSTAGATAAKELAAEELLADTVVVEHRGRRYIESAAAVRALVAMGKGWPLLGATLWLVPKPLRDMGYRWVARNRHRLRRGAS